MNISQCLHFLVLKHPDIQILIIRLIIYILNTQERPMVRIQITRFIKRDISP